MSEIKEKKVIADDSRDYDLKEIDTDPRIAQTTKEFWITLAAYIVFAVLMIANLLLLHESRVNVFGFPLWIFLEILIIIGFVGMVIFLTTCIYQDMDITPDGQLYEKRKKKERKA